MKNLARPKIIFVIGCLLSFLTASVIQPGEGLGGITALNAVSAQVRQGTIDSGYRIESTAISGGGYAITDYAIEILGTSTGGDYRLTQPSPPTLQGNGCCCLYLPCVFK